MHGRAAALIAASLIAGATTLGAALPAAAQAQPNPAAAQEPPPLPPPAPVAQESADAQQTRERLRQILRQLPPSVGEVLARDPALMTRADYLAPYPQLVAFLQQHPEIARNPAFFVGAFQYRERDPAARAEEMFTAILAGFGITAAVTAFLSFIVWLVRTVIDHRRWLRLSRVQAEVHTKLLDRLTSNEDLLAYIQTPAGRRFLESAPIALEDGTRSTVAPLGRIIWSMQAGIVLAALGLGFWFVRWNLDAEIAQGFFVMGTLIVALGAGFAAASVVAYAISSRMGLVASRRPEP